MVSLFAVGLVTSVAAVGVCRHAEVEGVDINRCAVEGQRAAIKVE